MGATAKIATAPGEETGDMSGSRAQTTADLSATNTVYFAATRSAQMRQEVASLDSDSPNGTALRRHVTWLSRRPKGLLPTWPQALGLRRWADDQPKLSHRSGSHDVARLAMMP